MLSLATLAASPAPALYGFLTDHWGFSASFVVGLGAASIGLVLVLCLPVGSDTRSQTSPS